MPVSAGEPSGIIFYLSRTDGGGWIPYTLELRERFSNRTLSIELEPPPLFRVTAGGQPVTVYPAIIAFGSQSMSAQILAAARAAVIATLDEQVDTYTDRLVEQIVDTTMIMEGLSSGIWDVSLRPPDLTSASVPIVYEDDIRSITVLSPMEANISVTPIVEAGEVPRIIFYLSRTDGGGWIPLTLELSRRFSNRIRRIELEEPQPFTVIVEGRRVAVYPVIIAFGSERMSAQILADARPAVIDIFEDQEVPYTAQLIGQIVDTTMLMDALGSGTWDVSLIPAFVPIRYADDIRSITVLPSQQNPPDVDISVSRMVSAGQRALVSLNFSTFDRGSLISFTLELREQRSGRMRSVEVPSEKISANFMFSPVVFFAPQSLSAQILEDVRDFYINRFTGAGASIFEARALAEEFVQSVIIVDDLDPGTWDISLRTTEPVPFPVNYVYFENIRSITVQQPEVIVSFIQDSSFTRLGDLAGLYVRIDSIFPGQEITLTVQATHQDSGAEREIQLPLQEISTPSPDEPSAQAGVVMFAAAERAVETNLFVRNQLSQVGSLTDAEISTIAGAAVRADVLEPGEWLIRIISPATTQVYEGEGSSSDGLTLNVLWPEVSLTAVPDYLPIDQDLRVTVEAEQSLPIEVHIPVRARRLGTGEVGFRTVAIATLSPSTNSTVVTIDTLPAAQWELSVPDNNGREEIVTIVERLLVDLSPGPVLPGSSVEMRIDLTNRLEMAAMVELAASPPEVCQLGRPASSSLPGPMFSNSRVISIEQNAQIIPIVAMMGPATCSLRLIVPPASRNLIYDQEIPYMLAVSTPQKISLQNVPASIFLGQVLSLNVVSSVPEPPMVTVTVRAFVGATSRTRQVQLMPGRAAAPIDFADLGQSGLWTFALTAAPINFAQVSTAAVSMRVLPAPLRLRAGGDVSFGSTVSLAVSAPSVPEGGLSVSVIGVRDGLPEVQEAQDIVLSASASTVSVTAEFAGLGAGIWRFSAVPAVPERGMASSPVSVVVRAELRLEVQPGTVRSGEAVTVATVLNSALPATVRLILAAEAPVGRVRNFVSFSIPPNTLRFEQEFYPRALSGPWRLRVRPSLVLDVGDAMADFALLPRVRLLDVPATVRLGRPVQLRAMADIPLHAALTIVVRASLGSISRTEEVRLVSGQEVALSFADLGQVGAWQLAAETLPADGSRMLSERPAEVRVRPLPAVLLEAPSPVPLGGNVTVRVRVEEGLPARLIPFTITAHAPDASILSRGVMLSASAASVTVDFGALQSGLWSFEAVAGELGFSAMRSAPRRVLVSSQVFSVRLSADPPQVLPGEPLTLTASLGGMAGDVDLEIAVRPPRGTPLPSVSIRVAADSTRGNTAFVPDARSGTWTFSVSEENTLLADAAAATATVLPVRLAFGAPEDALNADDLIFVLRYLRLCEQRSCDSVTLNTLADNLAGSRDPAQLVDLAIPNIDGMPEDMKDIIILLHAFSGAPPKLLLPAAEDLTAAEEQAAAARFRILQQLLPADF